MIDDDEAAFLVPETWKEEKPRHPASEINFDPHRAPSGGRDWHAHRNDTEPRCGADQWRTRDRHEVIYMHEMTDSHLGHSIRFASTKRQHASRLSALLAERERRRSAGSPS